MINPHHTANPLFSYSAFGRSFPTVAEAEAYGRSLLNNPEAWEGVTPPTSFTLFQHYNPGGCMPSTLYRVTA